MKSLATVLAAGLIGTLGAQSPLSMVDANNTFNAPVNVFFDLTVNNPITIHALDIVCNAAGSGTVQVFLGNGITTYVGSEANLGNWTSVALGSGVSAGAGIPTAVCLNTPVQLAPGTYAVAMNFSGTLFPVYQGTNAAPPTAVSNADLTLTPGAVQQNPFQATGGLFTPRRFSGNFYYFPGLGVPAGVTCAGGAASNTLYGDGCYRIEESFYTFYDETEANLLTGASMTLVPSAGSYIPLYNSGVPYVAPTGAATTLTGFLTGGLVNDDDGELTITLPQPFTTSDGTSVTSLNVHSNGIVSTGPVEAQINTANAAFLGAAAPAAGQSLSWAPVPGTAIDLSVEAWGHWHDFNIVEGGAIKWEVVGNTLYLTWEAVESYPDDITIPNPSTMQLQFELNTGGTPGSVSYVFQDITADGVVGGLAWSDITNVFYSPAGDSFNHGETDITAFNGTTQLAADDLPLAMVADTRPVIGSTVRYETINEPSPGVGLHFVSLASSAGLDPVVFGLTPSPGCEVHIDPTQGEGFIIATGGAFFDFPFPIDAALAGLSIYNQSIWINLAPAGTLILEMSNGVESVIGVR